MGERFEKGKFFLPQLMASAEAAKAGFDVIKEQGGSGAVADRGSVAIATVKGDIHDIGKNIVRMLLENYGYTVYDLGRDVEPQAVLDCVREHDIKLVGLSALMTTTVRGMEDTIALLREQAPDEVFVGGAVITAEYAEMVGAVLLQRRRRKREGLRRGAGRIKTRTFMGATSIAASRLRGNLRSGALRV